MAIDEALLELADLPTLRLYGWAPHAVSLGWFQKLADFGDVPADTPIVRRLTGGGAIHHGDELTFALAIAAERLPADLPASYALVHDAAIAALAAVGVIAERLREGHSPSARPSAKWCFAEPGEGDLVTPRGKLLGSAQRRIRVPAPRVLHHGSLVLRRPSLTPFVAAVDDAAATDAALRDRLADEFVARLAVSLGMEPFVGELTAAETAMATQLERDKYGDPSFTARR
jgi:lipoate-protein ligase A